MNIMIIGAGFTGLQLAKRLLNEKNTVTIIDNNEETIENVKGQLDCDAFAVDGNNLENLEEHGIEKQELVLLHRSYGR